MPKKGKDKPSAAGPTNGVLPKLKAVYDFMTQNNLESLEIDESDLHLRMVRRRSVPAAIPVPIAVGMSAPPVSPTVPAVTTHSSASPAGTIANGTTVKAPMMGIFYRAASPSSPPFVKEGDSVKAGQLLCMIEAMKVFNEIKADFPCTILKVLLENGKPAKSGQDLFLVQRG